MLSVTVATTRKTSWWYFLGNSGSPQLYRMGYKYLFLSWGVRGCLDVLVLTVLMGHVCIREVGRVMTTADTSSYSVEEA